MSILNEAYSEVYQKNGILEKKTAPSDKVAVVFPGHGSQYQGMLAGLDSENEGIQAVFERANQKYLELAGKELTPLWETEELSKPEVMQPSIVVANVALYEAIKPFLPKDIVFIGHSLGEISALIAAESISLEDGIMIAFQRAQVLAMLDEGNSGRMLALQMKENTQMLKVKECVEEHPKLVISIINSPKQLVLSGGNEAIQSAEAFFKHHEISAKVLSIPYPFHSKLLEELVGEFYRRIQLVPFQTASKAVFSTILGRKYQTFDFQQTVMPLILANQLIYPFNFKENIQALYDEENVSCFVECGANHLLSDLIVEILKEKAVVITTNRKREEASYSLQKAIAELTLSTQKEGDNIQQATELYQIISRNTGYPASVVQEIFAELGKVDLKKLALPEIVAKRIEKELQEKGLQESNVNQPDTEEKIEAIKQVIQEKTGYPIELLEEQADLEADLGIDSVKQVEILEVLAEQFGLESSREEDEQLNTIQQIADFMERKTEVVDLTFEKKLSDSAPEVEQNKDYKYVIKKTIQDVTGYPEELLEENADLEADLGIDSVKQAEIFSKVCEDCGVAIQEQEFDGKDLATINQISEFLKKKQLLMR